MFKKSPEILPVLLITLVQTIYLIFQFINFEWSGVDDLLTITLIDQENMEGLIQALSSGLNLFPPLYYLLSYFFITKLELTKDLLLWIHLPMFWVSIYFTYKLIKVLSSSWIASYATICIATLKSAFMTQAVYVRPYSLYYCSTLVLLFFSLRFQKEINTKNSIFLWISFQFLALSHYYGIIIGCLVCIPLLFSNLTFNKKVCWIIFLISPGILTHLYFLPKQLSFIFCKGTTPDVTFSQIIGIYETLCYPALVMILTFSAIRFFTKKKIESQNSPYKVSGLFFLTLFPLFIGILLYFLFHEGMYYRYFIPCQIGMLCCTIYLITNFISIEINTRNKVTLLFLSYALIYTWTFRNFSGNHQQEKAFYPNSLEFEKKRITESKDTFVTSHLPTFLKLIYSHELENHVQFVRTNKQDLLELPKFHKCLTPKTPKDLAKIDSFFYHSYYSGPSSIIDFNPEKWAEQNGYHITEISNYPVVVHLQRKDSI